MNLQELSTSGLLQDLMPEYSRYGRYSSTMPPLSVGKMKLRVLIGSQRQLIRAATGGSATLLLTYKQKEAALLCLDEAEDESTWDVVQVKGADSRVSYRVSTSMDVYRFFGVLLKNVVKDTRADVSKVLIPHFHDLIGIEQLPPERMMRSKENYARFRHAMGMRLDQSLGRYVHQSNPSGAEGGFRGAESA